MILSLLFLVLSIAARSVAELQQHGKLRWMQHDKYIRTFWDDDSYLRKYKLTEVGTVIAAPTTYYYKLFNIKYKERFPLSATLLVFLTDGYHLCQMLSFSFLSLAIVFTIGFSWWWLLGVMIGVRLVHGITYWLLSK